MASYDDLSRWGMAIQDIESSGGNYGALGPVTRRGDRAYGAYQIMGANIPSWTQAALGRSMTPGQFLSDEAAQDQTFAHRFGLLADKYGNPQDAASAWLTGRPLSQGGNARDQLGTSGNAYVRKFNQGVAQTYQDDLVRRGASNVEMGDLVNRGDGQYETTNLSDTPAAGAQPVSMGSSASYNVPNPPPPMGGIGAVVAPPGYSPTAPAEKPVQQDGVGGFMNGLRGDGEQWSMADGMIGAGASLMSVYNPQGAAALMAQLKHRETKQKKSPWALTGYDQSSGRGLYVNSETGQVQPMQVSAPYREMSSKDRDEFNDRHDKLSTHDQIINDANKYRGLIADGQIDLSAAAQFSAGARKLTDTSTPQDRNAANYAQFIAGLGNSSLRLNAGTQTEGDAVRTLNEIAPKMSGYDNAASIGALDAIIKSSRTRANSLIQAQNSSMDYFGGNSLPGTYRDDYRRSMSNYDKYDEDFGPTREAFGKQREAATAGQSGAPQGPRVAPAGSAPTTGFGAFVRGRVNR